MVTLLHRYVPRFHFSLHPPPARPFTSFTLLDSTKPFSNSISTSGRIRVRCRAIAGGQSEDEYQKHKHTDNSDKNPAEINNKNQQVTDPFLVKLAIGLGMAVALTFLSILVKHPSPTQEQSFTLQYLQDAASSSPSPLGFSFQAFGYRVVLPQYPPGWLYFWLLMAAGCGLFVSEEALNIWVGVSLSRLLLLDGTWQSFSSSFAKHTPYIASTVMWVYWGVCISDMIPFYLGKLFKQSNASEEVYSKFGIGKDKVQKITQGVRKYGNLIGFVERFSIGMRNPTAFVAGALGISAERFFAGVCLGGLITLPIQLSIGFLLRERPMVAIATVATAVGIWTIFPYALAACTALFLFLRNQIST